MLERIKAHPLFAQVTSFIHQEALLSGIEHIDAALSGGADSVCLLAVLGAMEKSFTLRAHHIRHGLRSDDGHDAEIARKVAETLGIAFIQTDLSWPELPTSNVEEAARERRYEAFFMALNGHSNAGLALAHHGDENLETAVWRLGRGCGLEGFGMDARKFRNGIALIRPLLTVSKQQIYAFLRDIGLEWAEDPTNEMDKYRRNRIRHNILPALKSEAMSDACLYRSIVQIRRDASALESLSEAFVRAHPVVCGGWFCPWDTWNALSRAAQAQVLRHAARAVQPGTCPSAGFVERALTMMAQKSQKFRQTDEGRIRAGWSHGGIMVWNSQESQEFPEIAIELPVSELQIRPFCSLSAWRMTSETILKNTTTNFFVDASAVSGRLSVLPASRFREVRNSIGNIIRLREALRSQGVPDIWRSIWPVLCNDGQPFWVPGGMRMFEARPAEPGKPAIAFSIQWHSPGNS
ncbi:MAG: tRNA lysidine(34) synthetase TilS [Proteobacteria bacterium]|nr:tRNA lysidine(34) synthetase TilS [Pseudomonadota bacterium]